MLQRLSSGVERLRHSAVAIPVAVLLAGLMLLVNEMAYRGAGSRLERLVQLGQARLLLLETVQRTAEAESGKRGFLLTQGPEYLQPYNESRQLVLRNLDRLLTEETGIAFYPAEDPMGCCARGAGRALEYYEVLKRTMRPVY